MKQYTKIDYSGYIPLCEHYPIKKSGFNFGVGGYQIEKIVLYFLEKTDTIY